MKYTLFILFITISMTVLSQGRKSPHDTISSKNITVTYGRPSVHERVIFGQLVKYGQVWRVGADEATTIHFNRETKFGESDIDSGTYTLFALVEQDQWTLIVNGVLGQWGAFSYEKNKDKNVAMVKVPVKKLDTPVEQLTIRFDGDTGMIIEWEYMQVRVPVKPND